jgi:hypothetical protein
MFSHPAYRCGQKTLCDDAACAAGRHRRRSMLPNQGLNRDLNQGTAPPAAPASAAVEQELDLGLAYNLAKRLKTLGGPTPFEYICQQWQKQPELFPSDPFHHTLGLYTLCVRVHAPLETATETTPAEGVISVVSGAM